MESSKSKSGNKLESHDEVENTEDSPLSCSTGGNVWTLPMPRFKKGDMKSHLLEESSFSVLFPQYREKYMLECWPVVEKVFEDYGIRGELDAREGRMSVFTTNKTWDPYSILKARDIIKLLGRSIPVEHALRLLKDDVTYELIKIKNIVRNKERFLKRRQRLIGANGTTLKALELLTDCYILVQGATVAAIGPHLGVKQVVSVVLDTMKNIHPIYLLKALMIKRELAKDPVLKNSDWSRFIPTFSSKNVKRKKPKKIGKPKIDTPFPPSFVERKIDQQITEGQYHTELANKKKWGKPKDKTKDKKIADIPVEEVQLKKPTVNVEVDVEKLKRKVKKIKKK